jgi:hypothetical protein
MFQILDLVIGLIFIYFLLSLICSSVQEVIANVRNLRFRGLQRWMLQTFQLNDFGHQIFQHHLIRGLTLSGKPSYIPSEKFSQAVLDLVHSQVHGDKPFDINSLREAMERTILLPAEMKRFVLQSIMEANGDLTKVRTDLAKWFDEAMERVGGYYKKRVQEVIIIVALVTVALFNADSIQITKYLYDNPDAARRLADQASSVVTDSTMIRRVEAIRLKADTLPKETDVALKEIEADLKEIKALSAKIYDTKLPLGWHNDTVPRWPWGWFEKMLGLLLTAVAVSMGTPFWFEVLNKLVNLRNAGVKPKSEVEEK